MNTKEKTKHSAFSNVMYMLKILWHGSRGYVLYTFIKEFTEDVFWTVFSVYLTEWIYIAIENQTPFAELASFVGAMCIGHICIHISSAIHQLCEKQFLPKMYQDFYKRVIRKSVSMEYTQFEKPDFYDKYTRALNECQQRGSTILYYSAYFVASIAAMVTAVIIVVKVDPVLLAFIVPMVAISLYFGKKCGNLYYELDFSNTRDGRTAAYAKRVFYEKKYAGELRLFGIGRLLLARHEEACGKMQERTREIRRKVSVLEVAKWSLFTLFSAVLPYLYIVLALQDKDVSTAAYVAMIPALGTLSWRTSDVVELMVSLAKESAFVSNLRDFLSIAPKSESASLKKAESLSDIEIKNMGFTYEGAEKPTLHDVNMTVRRGEKIAIVGHNGAGKTTLIKLIMRLYDVTDGSITFGGVDIRKLDTKEYRRRIAAVFQDFQIYGATLAENVKTDLVDESDREKVVSALEKADLKGKLAKLPNGIDTELTKEFSDSGTMLSGGEAQKAAIARMFMHDMSVAILDEPSSALDPIAEYRLNKSMLENAENQAVILISHRLSTTKDADRIILLENGSIAESGTHSELLAKGGTYAKMWNVQAEKYCVGIYA